FAKDLTPTQPPVFGASVPRRPASLSGRGGFGQQARSATGGQVRVLSPEEEAAAPPTSRARIATNTAAARANSLARVAIVVSNGARIRRLPQDSAVTLYKCAPGIQLAVLKQSGPWAAVLMSDKSTGWLPTKYLKITGETRDISFQITSGDPGGSAGGYAGDYAGENPMVAQALRWLGTPYRYGGTSRRGIDCSALVQTAFRACGYGLPRTAAQQARVGTPVLPAQLRAGDRLYFSASGSRVDHTGLYMGDGLFVHASGSGRQVMVSNLFTPRNWNIFVGARR
ncbi:MAG TPA: C40 family peptidase, partial [Abditibacterium sp.]